MLPTPFQRAIAGGLAVLAACGCVLAAIKAVPGAAWLYWLALPLAGYARIQLNPQWAGLWRHRQGLGRALLAGTLALLVGLCSDILLNPLLAAVRQPDRLYPLLVLSAVMVGLIVLQWRSWPWFGLLFVARLRTEDRDQSLWQRLGERARELAQPADAFARHGLIVACAGLLLVLAPMLVGWWAAEASAWVRAVSLGGLMLIGIELILRHTDAARQRPQPHQHLPSFLLNGAGDEDITDPEGIAVVVAELPPGPDQELLAAARAGDAEAVKVALGRGADANATPTPEAADQRTALIAAATAADRGALRALIAAGAEVDRMCGGMTALHAATRDSYAGRIDAVMTLLANGADPNRTDEAGNTPLHFAALTRDAGIAQSLLDAGARLDAINREEMTPLALACEGSNWVVVEFLVKRGARSDVDGATPALLFAAAVDGDDPRGVKLLLKAKARVNALGPHARSALMVAALADNAEIAEALLAAGAEVETRDVAGRSALLEAARAGANRVLQRLVFQRPDAHAVDRQGRGALHLAAQAGNADAETLQLLLALGCEAGLLDLQGETAADLAAMAGRWPLVRVLDPEYPIPSSHIEDEQDAQPERIERIEPDLPGRLLVRAAMQGRFPLYQELLQVPGISAAELAESLRVAIPHQDRRYVEAILDQGYEVYARDASGRSLWELLCTEQPLPLDALEVLLDRADRSPQAARVLIPGLCLIGAEQLDPDTLGALCDRVIALGDPAAGDALGRPALLLAVGHLPAAAIERLLAAGAPANMRDPAGATALTLLAWSRRKDAREIAPLLIRAGADPALAAADGTNPAGIARVTGQSELAQLLDWPAGAHPGCPLDGAAVAGAGKRGDLATLDRLLSLGLDVDGADDQGATALLHAAGTGQLELCKALLDRGADLNRASARGVAPLAAAILAGRTTVVEWLLAHGVNANGELLGQMNALALAAACLRQPLVEFLLQRGADPEGAGAAVTPLRATLALVTDPARPIAAVKAMLARLIEAGANPDRPDEEGRTPLLSLVGSGRSDVPIRDEARLQPLLMTLVQGGANPNATDAQGRTALHWICRHGLIQCGGALLELGADPRVTDAARQLPIDLLSTRHRIHLGPALRQAAEAWNRQHGPKRGG
jgi:uncharacterized protein